MNLCPKKSSSNFAYRTLAPIRNEVIPLPDNKFKDLKSVLEFIHTASCQFYDPLLSCKEEEYFPNELDSNTDD